MANNENLSNFVDPKVFDDISKLDESLLALVESIETVNVAAKQAFEGFGNVSNLKGLVDLTNKATTANSAMNDTLPKLQRGIKALTEEQLRANMSIKERNDLLKLQVAAEEAPAGSIAKVRAEAALLRNELMKLNLEKEKGRQEDLKTQLAQKDAFIKQNVDAYTAQKINIGNYPDALAQLAGIKAEMDALAATGQKDSEEFTQLATKMNQVKQSLGGLGGEIQMVTTTMEGLSTQMYVMKEAGLQLTPEFAVLQEQFDQMAIRGAELKAQIAGVGVAIKEAGVNSERGAIMMEKFGETMKEIGMFALTFFGVQAGMEFLSGISEEFEKADKAARNLRNTLDNVGSANLFGNLTKQAEEFADKFSYLDTYQVQDVFSKLITYGKLTESQINEALPVIIDFAAKTGRSLDESAGVIIKALEGSARGLKEFGINIKEAKTATGEALPAAERFGFIMEQLKPRVEGAAMAYKNSWGGMIEEVKKGFREAELSVADFFTRLSGIEQEQQKSAIAAKKEGEGADKLVTEYEVLSKKVKQTGDDKKRLQEITNELGNTFGNSVLSINEETGALELNIEATKDLIRQKLLLANQAASEQAMKYNSAKEDEDTARKQIAITKQLYDAQIAKTGETAEQAAAKISYTKSGQVLDPLNADETRLLHLKGTLDNYQSLLDDALGKKKKAMAALSELGFKEEDIDKLFAPGKLDPSKNNPDVPGGAKPDKEYIVQNEKALTDALYQQYKLQMDAKAAEQKAIVDNENEAYSVRKKALMDYNDFVAKANETEILNMYEQKRFEIGNMEKKPKESDDSFAARKKIANQELLNIELEYNAKVLEDKKQAITEGLTLDQKYVDERKAILDKQNEAFDSHQTDELIALNDLHNKKLISEEEYQKRLAALEYKYKLAKLINDKAFYENAISDDISKGINPAADQSSLIKTNNALAALQPPKGAAKKDKTLWSIMGLDEEQAKSAQAIYDTAAQEITSITQMLDKRYQMEIDNLEKIKAQKDLAYNNEINAINGSLASEQRKAAAISVLNAQKAASDKAIHDQEVALKRKQAESDRVASIASAIQKGVIAVLNALDTEPAPLGIALAAVVGATVAAQIAQIVATPLPSYGTGTEDHPGGWAEVGELNKPEYIFEPGKAPVMVNRSTKMNLAQHTRVLTEEQMLKDSMDLLPDSMLYNIGINSGVEYVLREEIGGLKGKIDDLTSVIRDKRENHFHWNNGELRKSIKNGSSVTEYIDRNFN